MLYPVQYGSPALHSDALEDSEHGESDVVEAGDAEVWSHPVIHARRGVRVAHVGPERRLGSVVRVTRARLFALFHDNICNRTTLSLLAQPSTILPSNLRALRHSTRRRNERERKIEQKRGSRSSLLTDVPDAVTRLMQSSRIKLEADDSEYHDGEKHQQADLQKRGHRFDNRLEHHLETCSQKIAEE